MAKKKEAAQQAPPQMQKLTANSLRDLPPAGFDLEQLAKMAKRGA